MGVTITLRAGAGLRKMTLTLISPFFLIAHQQGDV